MLADINFKTKVIFFVSLTLLSLLFACYSDIFLFSKTVSVPNWIGRLPNPLGLFDYPGFTRITILICLLPVVLVNESLMKAGVLLLLTGLLSFVPVVVIYAVESITGYSDYREWLNIPFQLFWIAIYHGHFAFILIYLILFLKLTRKLGCR